MPKPKKNTKKFIDPKNERTTTFALIHRSQKDPLAADPDAPQRVLQPLITKEEAKKRKEEEHKYGVFFDDNYDYLQHMKDRQEVQYDWDQVDKFLVEKEKDESKSSNVKLPGVVFASKEVEEVGLLNKAAPHSGPLLDWDPDIVETLDDEFSHEVVYTLKDEDLEEGEAELDAILAEAKLEGPDESDDEEYDSYDSDEALDDVPSLDGGFSNFSDEETKSKFTSYSMSSSVIRRNDQLSLLDDKFEKFFDDYDEENLGGLDQDEIEGCHPEDSEIMNQMVREFEKFKKEERQPLEEENRKGLEIYETSDNEVELLKLNEEEAEDKFDCESILTTYSTLYNHPKLIREPSIKPIKVSGKTGIPKDVLGKGLTSAALKQLDRENRERQYESSDDEDDVETMTLASRVSQLSFRNKHESKEEKKARKQALKDLRRERRVEKKANRDAFKEEKTKQEKHAINIRLHCNQAVKLC